MRIFGDFDRQTPREAKKDEVKTASRKLDATIENVVAEEEK